VYVGLYVCSSSMFDLWSFSLIYDVRVCVQVYACFCMFCCNCFMFFVMYLWTFSCNKLNDDDAGVVLVRR